MKGRSQTVVRAAALARKGRKRRAHVTFLGVVDEGPAPGDAVAHQGPAHEHAVGVETFQPFIVRNARLAASSSLSQISPPPRESVRMIRLSEYVE